VKVDPAAVASAIKDERRSVIAEDERRSVVAASAASGVIASTSWSACLAFMAAVTSIALL